jgi:hypothetical protein
MLSAVRATKGKGELSEMLAEERGGFRALSGKEKNNGKKMRGGGVVARERKNKRGGLLGVGTDAEKRGRRGGEKG